MTGRDSSPATSSSQRGSSQRITRHPLPPGVKRDAALRSLRETAESWGATFEAAEGGDAGGQLGMPAAAGMRMGWLEGRVSFDEVQEEDRKAAKRLRTTGGCCPEQSSCKTSSRSKGKK